MPPSSRIPPLLQPHTRLPDDDSIILLTSTLGASANWLIIRFLCEALSDNPNPKSIQDEGPASEGKEPMAVVLVSWMRDWEYWRSEARKGGGLDLERLKREKRLAFVDGLSKLFLPEIEGEAQAGGAQMKTAPPVQGIRRIPGTTERPPTILPVRGPPGRIPARAPPTATPNASASPTTSPSGPQGRSPTAGHYELMSPQLSDLQTTVETAIRHLQSTSPRTKILLILDTPTLPLTCSPDITYTFLCSTILRLHTLTSHILVHLPADDALIAPSEPPQPLEVDAHNVLVKMAHMSSRILSCRVLDTGVAKDVSGVLRVTENPAAIQVDFNGTKRGDRGVELLYLVKGDGAVKVFERGAGGDT